MAILNLLNNTRPEGIVAMKETTWIDPYNFLLKDLQTITFTAIIQIVETFRQNVGTD